MTVPAAQSLHATVLGVPRIGPRRELKKALESYWKDSSLGQELADTARSLTISLTGELADAGLDSVPSAGRSYYDAVLDAIALFGVFPARTDVAGDHDPADGLPAHINRYFTTARGTTGIPASAMTKWFDTNYHYIVPELSKETEFFVNDTNFVDDIGEQVGLGQPVRPVIVGPVTFLALSRTTDGSDPLADHLDTLTDRYVELLTAVAATGVEWIQIDEPYLVTDAATDDDLLSQVTVVYKKLAKAVHAETSKLLVATYFGDGDGAVKALQDTGVDAIAVDLVTGRTDERVVDPTAIVADTDLLPSWKGNVVLVCGVVDGRNIWKTDLLRALTTLELLRARGPVAVSTSCSLLHVPYALAEETSLAHDPELASWLAFGAEKVAEVALLSRLLTGTATDADRAAVANSAKAGETRRTSPRTHNAAVRERIAAVTDADRRRSPYATRKAAQGKILSLPPLPTTTIGSFPQTSEIRKARAAHKRGELTDAQYTEAMKKEVALVIAKQEDLGLDVLVHGEPERNDMVQYFSEQLDGYHSTDLGWVQSYGSRCVRPPILFGDVTRPAPMTVSWFTWAQSLTGNPVKGMLTGPVTMLAWSFVRDDQPLGETADQVALALRDEIDDLAKAGAKIVQVDEPAIRELLPLRENQQPAYLAWSVGAFRLATAGADDDLQIHTHMCYSEFNELIHTVKNLDADVTSIEASRNGMTVLAALKVSGFDHGVGPGVWDIHSPRVPHKKEVDQLIADALDSVAPESLWINPDCGLKTRAWPETIASLKVLVAAAKDARKKL